jgi:dipeptidase E
MPELLLLSNSVSPGLGVLEHALAEIGGMVPPGSKLLFLPQASSEPDRYTQVMTSALAPLSVRVCGAQAVADPVRELDGADAVFTGGGNSFRLLRVLQASGLLAAIRERVAAGMPYLGASAGANVACPTIRTTNDMPIVQPASLDALGLIPFQINPHYLDPDPHSPHQGETRPQRIREFLEENDVPVLALREGSWLRVSGSVARVGGLAGGIIFTRHEGERGVSPGNDVSHLLSARARFDTAT